MPVWDRNKGAITAAEAALIRASEGPHRVEMNLTNTLATAYSGYKNNLEALEYYRRYILPDQVRTIAAPTTAGKSTPMRPSATWSAQQAPPPT